jgi:glycosyltransferase involved in cell wall biosynthesis
MDYLSLDEASAKFKQGDTSELVLKSIEKFYTDNQNIWIDDITQPLIKTRLDWIKSKLIGLTKPYSILDVGSWTGAFANALYVKDLTTIDCLEIGKAVCELGKVTFPQLNFVNVNVQEFQPTKLYDVIIIADILEHLPNPKDIIARAKSWLVPGGRILITMPDKRSVYKDGVGEHISHLEFDTLKEFTADITLLTYQDWTWYAVCILTEDVKSMPDNGLYVHILGMPNYIAGWETAPNNPFNTKIQYMCKILHSLGYNIIYYGVEGSIVPFAEIVTIVSKGQFETVYGDRDPNALDNLDEEDGPIWKIFVRNAITEIAKRIHNPKKEFLLNFQGSAYRAVTDTVKDSLLCVEPGIGHGGQYLDYKIWESYAWQNFMYGHRGGGVNVFPNLYETVIPAYFDKIDYPFEPVKDDFLLYIGRITWGKGVSVAIDVARRMGKKLVIIGGGDYKAIAKSAGQDFDLSHVTYLGVLGKKHKMRYISKAAALFYFSLYVEPFGHAPVEAMMCGTPVICSDLGAFTETVQNGVTGYRCRTMDDLYWAVKSLHKLDPYKIRQYAIDNFSLEAVAPRYANYFKQLIILNNGGGWYSIDENNPANLETITKKYQ